MTQEATINREYLDWMYNKVCNDQYSRNVSYHKLFEQLHDTDFTYILPMDDNRAEDGVNLRYRFGQEAGYEDAMVSWYLDNRPCSVLEMMLALAIRVEISIMDNPDIGDRSGQWFWEMVVSLGLGGMTDENYDYEAVDERLYIFLNRKYARNGAGGLFTIRNSTKDMRNIDIWYQMCFHLNEVLGE